MPIKDYCISIAKDTSSEAAEIDFVQCKNQISILVGKYRFKSKYIHDVKLYAVLSDEFFLTFSTCGDNSRIPNKRTFSNFLTRLGMELGLKLKCQGINERVNISIKTNEAAISDRLPKPSELSCSLSNNDEETEPTYNNELSTLIGRNEFKKKIAEMYALVNRIENRRRAVGISDPIIDLNTILIGNPGSGKKTAVNILYKMFVDLEVVDAGNLIKIERGSTANLSVIEKQLESIAKGLVYLDLDEQLLEGPARSESYIRRLVNSIEKYKRKVIFIISCSLSNTEMIKLLNEKNNFSFEIVLEDFNEEETYEISMKVAAQKGYKLAEDARDTISILSENAKANNIFLNYHTVKSIIEKALLNKELDEYTNNNHDEIALTTIGNLSSPNILSAKYFPKPVNSEEKKPTIYEISPFDELNGLIGLESIKEMVNNISSYAELQVKRRELGIHNNSLNMHMQFSGNPGTGKTTVARLLGRILNRIGLLETGKFVEVSRVDLVGQYVGHTAPKTLGKIKEAYGGVLFIDEAYSICNGHGSDFGYEALATLIKEMEDKRNKLIVIFAGYHDEMNKFVSMNPGLKDRIQFKLEFPDYNAREMFMIFKKFCYDYEYSVDIESEAEINRFFKKVEHVNLNNFSNARFVRNCFEKVLLIQAKRLSGTIFEKQELSLIKHQDVKALYQDREICEIIQPHLQKARKIGFLA